MLKYFLIVVDKYIYYDSPILIQTHISSMLKTKQNQKKMGLAKVRFVASNSRTPVRADLSHSQLEESNRTLTVDVANLASEKEELNNHLKELQQRESSRKKKKQQTKTLCHLFCKSTSTVVVPQSSRTQRMRSRT